MVVLLDRILRTALQNSEDEGLVEPAFPHLAIPQKKTNDDYYFMNRFEKMLVRAKWKHRQTISINR